MPAAITSASSASAVPAPQAGGFRRLWRTLKQLFHEIVGALFAILALAWLNNAFRAWTGDTAHWLIALAVIVAAIFTFFAVSSFRRARKI
jgi:type IV secretory pathway VirB2 component (pilin)